MFFNSIADKREEVNFKEEKELSSGLAKAAVDKLRPGTYLYHRNQSAEAFEERDIEDKNNTIWKATLNVANSANGEKYYTI